MPGHLVFWLPIATISANTPNYLKKNISSSENRLSNNKKKKNKKKPVLPTFFNLIDKMDHTTVVVNSPPPVNVWPPSYGEPKHVSESAETAKI